jgi:UDP-N-acetyl-D-galactosamine dehydrogenase
MEVDIYDPWASKEEVSHEYGIEIIDGPTPPELTGYSAIILAVAHRQFKSLSICKSDQQVVFDVKAVLDKDLVDARL